ncbi:Nuclear pore complex protein NUP85-like protein [Drosera capensis]
MPPPAPSPESTSPLSLIVHTSQPQPPPHHPIHHSLPSPISRLAVSWSRGNTLRVSLFRTEEKRGEGGVGGGGGEGGSVVELKLGDVGTEDGGIGEAEWRRIEYGSATPFAVLQSRKNAVKGMEKMPIASLLNLDWSEYVMEYSKEINSLLGDLRQSPAPTIDDPSRIVKDAKQPTGLKAAWELLEIFYADKLSHSWLPERLVDWLADFDCVFSQTQTTVHSKLVDLQNQLVHIQTIEDNHNYWKGICSAVAVGWLDTAVKLLRLHGSYQLDQIGDREIENGLVEAVAILISQMPRLRPELVAGQLGDCYGNRPDFNAAREKWRGQLTKLQSSGFWVQCSHTQTREGLQSLIKILLGDIESLSASTCVWVEFYISQLLYVRPFTVGLEGMYTLAQKCMQLKPVSHLHSLLRLMIGILGENTEVVLAECSKAFGPWMTVHAIELLTTGGSQSEIILQEERHNLGGVSIEEIHRIVYAQVLTSHPLTWQLAPIYLMSCAKLGMVFLEMLLYRQPVQNSRGLLKARIVLVLHLINFQNLEFCRLYGIDSVKSRIMKIAGMHHWKHGRKGPAIYWLQQAQDHVRLNKIAQQLFDVVGKSVSTESFKNKSIYVTMDNVWGSMIGWQVTENGRRWAGGYSEAARRQAGSRTTDNEHRSVEAVRRRGRRLVVDCRCMTAVVERWSLVDKWRSDDNLWSGGGRGRGRAKIKPSSNGTVLSVEIIIPQWEGLIELLGSDSTTTGGLDFLHKYAASYESFVVFFCSLYRDFKKSLQQVHDGKADDAARQAVESLIKLLKNPSTPQRFWLPLLYDSVRVITIVKLLTWSDGPLLNASQTNLLLNKLQELSLARLRPDYVEADLPPQALSSVRLALATNLGRAFLRND